VHSYILTRTTWLFDQIQQTRCSSALVEETKAFSEVLECFPDYPLTAFSSASMQRVQAQADGVIDLVERCVAASPDDRRNQRLVTCIYNIRRAVEEIDHWQKHYAGYMKRQSA
jgi:hypothetical protein